VPASSTVQAIYWRGIASFLTICFALTWTIEFLALARGVRFATLTLKTTVLLAGCMFLPAISAFITRRFITREVFSTAGLTLPRSLKPYLAILIGVPCIFALIYALTALFRFGSFTGNPIIAITQAVPLPPGKTLPPARVLIFGMAVTTFVIAPIINIVATFGEEFGWTGYLLPHLLPLGRWRATAIYGTIWGLWHAPIVAGGFNYPGHPVLGIVMMCAFTISIGLIQCALRIRYGSVILTSLLHAAINANARGLIPLLFAGISLLVGGPLGVIGISVFAIAGAILLSRSHPPSPPLASSASLTPSP
jgi:membrane protease YdiL (CAAX protease family)